MTENHVLARWVRFWDTRESPIALCATRILVGLAVFGDLAYAEWIGARAAAWAPPPFGVGWGLRDAEPLVARALGASAETANLVFGIALGASLLFTLGACFRPAAFVLVLALAQLAHFAPSGDRGIDKILRVALLVLALSAAARRWSFDAWLATWRGRVIAPDAPAWPRYLLFAQLTWMYFSAAHNRADPAWWPHGGLTAIARILNDPHVARFQPDFVPAVYPVLQGATAATMAFELSAPLLIVVTWLDRRPERGGRLGHWVRRLRLRWLWLVTGVALHLGIALTMRLGVFPFGILALYPLLFHPDELERWLGRLRATAAG